MKITLKVASILTWFNLIVWGYFLVNGLLGAFSMGALPLVAILFLLSAIPLNCYAALQLQKSIKRPEIKLSPNTPVGIRFVGIVAFFFAFFFVVSGTVLMQNVGEMLTMLKAQYKD